MPRCFFLQSFSEPLCAVPFCPLYLCLAGWAARFGSGLFLVIQMIILLDFTQSWNDAWAAAGEDDDRWLYALLGVTVACFTGTCAG